MDAPRDVAGRRNLERGRRGKDDYARERQAAFIAGELPVEELTMAELMKGRIANEDGSFSAGRLPRLPQTLLGKMTTEVARRAKERLRRFGDTAVQELIDLAKDEETPHGVRFQCLQLAMAYAIGKPIERVEVASSDPWQDIIDGIMAEERGGVGGDNSEPTGRKGSTPRGASPHT
jgi:hypothetical protein